MAKPTERKAALLSDAGQPLVLVGPPRDLRGEFRIQNATGEKIVVRQPVVRTLAVAGRTKTAYAVPEAELVLRRIVVRPGQSRPVPIALALDPRTPPGTYEAQLDVDGEQRSVIMHVTEDLRLSIAPSRILLPNRPKEKVRKQVVFTNEGNVPITVKSLGTVLIDEELAHSRAFRGALSDAGDTMEDIDDFAVALGRHYRKIYDALVLKVQNDEITIAPTETQALELNITLPEKLEKRSRYSGYAAIATNNLRFTIMPD
jgi:hypothetical protein